MTHLYLATPFSHKHFWIRWYRFWIATKCAAKLMQDGYVVFSPISHSFTIACFMGGHLMQSFSFWMRQDLPMVDYCHCIVVLKFGNAWMNSRGVQRELSQAAQYYKPYIAVEQREILNGSYLSKMPNMNT